MGVSVGVKLRVIVLLMKNQMKVLEQPPMKSCRVYLMRKRDMSTEEFIKVIQQKVMPYRAELPPEI